MVINQALSDFLTDVIGKQESYDLEFKKCENNLPKTFWETYSSFANTRGGYIVLGVSEDKSQRIVGVNNSDKIKKELFSSLNNPQKVSHAIICNDDINEFTIDDKIIMIIYIRELPDNQKPLYLNDNLKRAYIRKHDGDFLISQDDLKRFLRNAQADMDSDLLDEYILDDLNINSILALKNLINIREPNRNFMDMDNFAFLKQIGIFREDRFDGRKWKLTIAGLLLLGKLDAITQKFPHFHLEYINKRGTTRRWKDRVATGEPNYPDLNVFEYYQIVSEKLCLTVEEKFELDDNTVRKPASEMKNALREALANMLIHADYFDAETTIKIVVNDLDYTFQNPGKMRVSKEQFFSGGDSKPRNNTLMLYFRRMGESERVGTGGKEIIDVVIRNKYFKLPT